MAPSYNRDEMLRNISGHSFDSKRAREIDKYLTAAPTGTIQHRWVDSETGGTVGFNH